MTEGRHPLLTRQLRRARASDGSADARRLLEMIEAAYRDHDRALRLADRATSLASEELMALNDTLRDERDAHLAARDGAVAANAAKSNFLARMSHELRTPLTAIIGFAEITEEDANQQGLHQMSSDATRILAAARHLLGLINEVLDLAKVESGTMAVIPTHTDLDELTAEVMTTAGPLAAKNCNELVLVPHAPLGWTMIDAMKVRQCLLNLISNACKFTHEGIVRLEAAWGGDERLVFAVSDNGVGILPERQHELFQPFVQIHDGPLEGTGLGLAITKRMCELMGGEITLASEPGCGSRFTIELPARAALYAAAS
jgi:adenylate cyclase